MDVYRLLGFDAELGAIPPAREIVRQRIAKPDPVMFDVGANVGQSIERFRSLFPAAVIHAFEPEPAAFDELSRRFGGLDSVILNDLALGDRTGMATLHESNLQAASSLLPLDPSSPWGQALQLRAAATRPVRIDTIDRYCGERSVASIDFLKLDVQGFEPECLSGAAAMLAARRIGMIQLEIILHPVYARPTGFADIERLLAPHGYRLLTIFDLGISAGGELLQLDGLYVPA